MENPAAPIPSSQETTAEQLFTRALDLFHAGHHRDASSLIEQLYQLEPRNPKVWNLAGATARALGQRREAEQLCKTALQLKPDYAEAHYNLGVLLLESRRYAEAEAEFRTVLVLAPPQVTVLNNLGGALDGQSRVEEALACYERAIELDPQHLKAHNNRGLALSELGRLDEAQKALETALMLAPDNATIHRSLTTLKRLSPDDPQLAAMEKLAERMDLLPPDDRVQLNFALGKSYADIGQHERSFRYFTAGNAEKRKQLRYDEAAVLAAFDQIRASFTPERLRSPGVNGKSAVTPVFILGMPRSGSSLVEQILASHPQVFGAGECDDFKWLAEALLFDRKSPPMPALVATLTAGTLEHLGQRYLSALRSRAPNAHYITDKLPMNFPFAGLIHLALPSAKIIHTQRDAVDTCLSCFERIFTGDHPFAYDLAELGRFWRAYDKLMSYWREALPPGVMLEVRYEDLVANTEAETRRMLAHCGLEWDDACMAFHQNPRPVRTSSLTQVRQPIYRKQSHPWRALEESLHPLLDALQHEAIQLAE